jgi:prepilin-type processing-associated H-X9-DG protein
VVVATSWGYKLGERVPFLMADGSAASLRVVAN